MHSASLPYTLGFLSLTVAALLVLPAAADDVNQEGRSTSADGLVRVTGTGAWGTNDSRGPANATWYRLDGTIHAFVVQADITHPCVIAEATPCAARTAPNGTVHLQATAGGTDQSGVFTPTGRTTLLDRPPEPSPVPGIVISTTAALFAIATTVLAILLFQERRITRYLVRRLYEETRGHTPADWPEALRHQWIARIFVRGKN